MELCPVCRHRDATCKIRMLRGQTFFSCKSCHEMEERKAPAKPSRDYWKKEWFRDFPSLWCKKARLSGTKASA